MVLLKEEIAIIILSCDRFSVTWQPCIDHFFDAWPDCPYSVYLLNNFQYSTDSRVKNLLVGEDNNWSDTLMKGLEKVTENRVFFVFDDTFIINLKLNEINLIFKRAVEDNLDSVSLRRKSFDKGSEGNLLYLIKSTAKYRNSLFMNLIRKDLLLRLLKSGESAWQFEKEGNNRNIKYKFYSVYQNEIVIYHHGIVKGRWLPDAYNYLRSRGYPLVENTFQVHSIFRVIILKVYTHVWNFTQKFLHSIPKKNV